MLIKINFESLNARNLQKQGAELLYIRECSVCFTEGVVRIKA